MGGEAPNLDAKIADNAGRSTLITASPITFCRQALLCHLYSCSLTYMRRHTLSAAPWIRRYRVAAPWGFETLRSPNFTRICGGVVPSLAREAVAKLNARALRIAPAARVRRGLE